MLCSDSALSGVAGVYNAVEIVGEPIGNVMFYGQGAGAGATASAVVGDLVQIMCTGVNYAEPTWVKSDEGLSDFGDFKSRNYIALTGAKPAAVEKAFGTLQVITDKDELAFVTDEHSEKEVEAAIKALKDVKIKSRIRLI